MVRHGGHYCACAPTAEQAGCAALTWAARRRCAAPESRHTAPHTPAPAQTAVRRMGHAPAAPPPLRQAPAAALVGWRSGAPVQYAPVASPPRCYPAACCQAAVTGPYGAAATLFAAGMPARPQRTHRGCVHASAAGLHASGPQPKAVRDLCGVFFDATLSNVSLFLHASSFLRRATRSAKLYVIMW